MAKSSCGQEETLLNCSGQGDDYQYLIKGSGEYSYKLESGKSMKMKDLLFVPRLKKNLLSILALDTKGMTVAFVDGQVLM